MDTRDPASFTVFGKRRFINQLELLNPLGRGMYSQVHLVRHAVSGTLYALKVYPTAMLENRRACVFDENGVTMITELDKVHNDINIHAALPHTDYFGEQCQVIHDEAHSQLMIVMEYFPGGQFLHWNSNRLRYSVKLPNDASLPTSLPSTPLDSSCDHAWFALLKEEVIRPCIRSMLRALKDMHALEIVHKDIKPDNVLLSQSPSPDQVEFFLLPDVEEVASRKEKVAQMQREEEEARKQLQAFLQERKKANKNSVVSHKPIWEEVASEDAQNNPPPNIQDEVESECSFDSQGRQKYRAWNGMHDDFDRLLRGPGNEGVHHVGNDNDSSSGPSWGGDLLGEGDEEGLMAVDPLKLKGIQLSKMLFNADDFEDDEAFIQNDDDEELNSVQGANALDDKNEQLLLRHRQSDEVDFSNAMATLLHGVTNSQAQSSKLESKEEREKQLYCLGYPIAAREEEEEGLLPLEPMGDWVFGDARIVESEEQLIDALSSLPPPSISKRNRVEGTAKSDEWCLCVVADFNTAIWNREKKRQNKKDVLAMIEKEQSLTGETEKAHEMKEELDEDEKSPNSQRNLDIFDAEGTQMFTPPECFQPRSEEEYLIGKRFALDGSKRDLWSVGVTLFVALFGHPPFRGESSLELQLNLIHEELVCPNFRSLTDECWDFLLGCLRKNPKERMSVEEALEHPWIKNCSLPTQN
eukprot:GDKJ01039899.1.p1 GENE.GDKJ01039899.1~~GDKJ01039899.1.p1  ORF type:complete len:695 (-),score=159.70 GDKJ01039899.1:30-2114(-)